MLPWLALLVCSSGALSMLHVNIPVGTFIINKDSFRIVSHRGVMAEEHFGLVK